MNIVHEMDAVAGLRSLPRASVDCVICDPPYGLTRNEWDECIPFCELWDALRWATKPTTPIIMFGLGIFSAKLVMSNQRMWRYKWVWEKTQPTGFLNAKNMPLRTHEDIHVFYARKGVYNPQKTQGHKPVNAYTRKLKSNGTCYGAQTQELHGGGNTDRYPRDVLKFSLDTQKSALHPTQKPVDLIRYLVRTYSNEGDLVVDPTAGSGTTGIACLAENRRYLLFDNDRKMCDAADARIIGYLEKEGAV